MPIPNIPDPEFQEFYRLRQNPPVTFEDYARRIEHYLDRTGKHDYMPPNPHQAAVDAFKLLLENHPTDKRIISFLESQPQLKEGFFKSWNEASKASREFPIDKYTDPERLLSEYKYLPLLMNSSFKKDIDPVIQELYQKAANPPGRQVKFADTPSKTSVSSPSATDGQSTLERIRGQRSAQAGADASSRALPSGRQFPARQTVNRTPSESGRSVGESTVGYAMNHPELDTILTNENDPVRDIPRPPRMPNFSDKKWEVIHPDGRKEIISGEVTVVENPDGTKSVIHVDPEFSTRRAAYKMLNDALSSYDETNLQSVNAPESQAYKAAISKLYSTLEEQARRTPQEHNQLELLRQEASKTDPSLERNLATETYAPITEEEMKAYEDPYKNDVISDLQRRALERFKEEESDRRRDHLRNQERAFNGNAWNSGARKVHDREFEDMERRRTRDFDDNLNTQIRLALQHGNHESFGRLMQMRNLKSTGVSHHKNLTQDEYQQRTGAADQASRVARDIAMRKVAQYESGATIAQQQQREQQARRDRTVAEQHRVLNQGINHATTALNATGRAIPPVQYQEPLPQMPQPPQRSGWGDGIMTANSMYHQHQMQGQQQNLMNAQTNLANAQAQSIQTPHQPRTI